MSQSEYDEALELAASQGNGKIADGCGKCHDDGNWIHVRYEYPDRSPVTDAVYVVQKPNGGEPGGEILAEGLLSVGEQSSHEFIHVNIGDHTGEVEVFFYDDPAEPIPYEEPSPVVDERDWFEKAADATVSSLKDAAAWTGGVLAGDFNENMSTSQIITNTVATMVPGLDQIGDIRDLSAHAKMLIWDKRYDDKWVWIGVVACLIGLVPTLGSLAKGLIKLAFKNLGNIGQLLVLINRCGNKLGFKINGVSFIQKVAKELLTQSSGLVRQFNDFLDSIARGVENSIGFFNRTATDRILRNINEVKDIASRKIPESCRDISELLTNGLIRAGSTVFRARNRMAIRVERSLSSVVKLRRYDNWDDIAKDAKRADYDINAPDPGRVPESKVSVIKADNVARLEGNLASLKQQLADDPNHPWHGFKDTYTDNDWRRQLEKFSGSPRIHDFEAEPMVLYRVVSGKHSSGGDYWSPLPPPKTEAAWRSRDAVLHNWNEAGAFVKMQIPPPRYGLLGEVGPQASENVVGDVLQGGGKQVYFPKAGGPKARETIAPFKSLDEIEEQIRNTKGGGFFLTPWNQKLQSTALISTSRLGKASECDI